MNDLPMEELYLWCAYFELQNDEEKANGSTDAADGW